MGSSPLPENGHSSGLPLDTQQPGAAHPGATLQELFHLVSAGRRVILGTMLAVVAAALLITSLMQPVYESTALLLIDLRAKQRTLTFSDFGLFETNSKISNEIETLKSVSLAEAVADTLLAQRYIDSTRTTLIPLVRMAHEEADGNLTPRQIITMALQRRLDVSLVRESDIIKVSVRSTEALEAFLVMNTYTRLYRERNLLSSRVRTRTVREFLESQMVDKHRALDTVENALQGYMKSSGMVSLDFEAKKVVEQLAQLEANRNAIDIEIHARTKTLTSYKEELATQEPNVAKAIGASDDSYIRLLQDQLAKLEVQRDVVIAQNPVLSGEKIYSDKIKEIDTQIGTLKANLKSRTEKFLATLIPGGRPANTLTEGSAPFLAEVKQKIIEGQVDLDGLVARKQALNGVISEYERMFDQIPQKNMQLARLQRAQLSTEKLYLLVQEKFHEAAISESSELGYVTVMDPATLPVKPVAPHLWLNLLIGLVAGVGFGVVVVVLRAALDVRVSAVEDLKRRGYTVLSTVGILRAHGRNGKDPAHAQAVPAGGAASDGRLVAYLNPVSPDAESYRHLRTNIKHAMERKPIKTILLTSANPGEGKSTTAANLAVSFTETDDRVLLIDADMRRPALHAIFGQPKERGLADYLLQKAEPHEIVRPAVTERLDLICCGSIPANPAAILGSKRMRQLIEQMAPLYDVILLDSAPLHAVSDATLLVRLADASIVVVGSGSTRLPALERVMDNLKGLDSDLLGLVLNKFDVRKALRATYGDEGFGYYSYSYGGSASEGRGGRGGGRWSKR